jgi:hypothetical protein
MLELGNKLVCDYEGGLISLWLYKEKQQATGLKKCIYITYFNRED